MSAVTACTHAAIADIAPQDWDRLANPAGAPFNPFISHTFLLALEKSGSAHRKTGWQPVHFTLQSNGTIVAAAPAYVKSHSYGEYVFDHGWAQAFERAGGEYYPKLQVAVPFTPVTGRRLLVGDSAPVKNSLITAIQKFCNDNELSSAHITFQQEDEARQLVAHGFLQRHDQQFHWHNRGYATFEQFLEELSSIKRKNLRRERREALAPGIEIEWITGSDLKESHWDAFFSFYMDTGSRKWGSPYLTRDFFSILNETMAAHVLLVLAKRNGRYIAGALNLIGSDTLYGRNWGAIEHHPFLHFELCYYQAIDFAISRKLATVEAGAQGEHKLARGYLPVRTFSSHWIAHPGLRDAVARYLTGERHAVSENIEFYNEHSPFRKIQTPGAD